MDRTQQSLSVVFLHQSLTHLSTPPRRLHSWAERTGGSMSYLNSGV